MKLSSLILGVLVCLTGFSSASLADTAEAQKVLSISKNSEMELIKYVVKFEGMRADVPQYNLSSCIGSISKEGKLVGRCWVHVTTYSQSSLEEVNKLIENNGYGTYSEFVIRAQDGSKEKVPKAKIEQKRTGYYEVQVKANSDGSDPKIMILTLE